MEKTLKEMTLEEKIGQLIVAPLMAPFLDPRSSDVKELERRVTQYKVGGFHTFARDPTENVRLLNHLQKLAKVPLLITADLEGGAGYQFNGGTRVPRAMALGATGSEELVYEAGRITALEGRALGIGVNFYPVVDVNNNPRNPIINIRAFGEDPAQVARLGAAYIRGSHAGGLLATAKHFPGHGDTAADSHMELPIIELGRERLDQIELPPFRAAVEAGVDAVMTAHICLPKLDPDPCPPASLSPTVTTNLLRDNLRFPGLIFTDALTMNGVTTKYSPEEAAVLAVKAGADVLLIPVDSAKTVQALKRAVESGEIPLERIEASARRILEAKAQLGLHENRLVEETQATAALGKPEHQQVARTMMERALTLVRDDRKVIPLRPKPGQRVLFLTLLDTPNGWRDRPGIAFAAELRQRFPNVDFIDVRLDNTSTRETVEAIKELANIADAVITNAYIRVAAYKGSIELTPWQLDLLRYISKSDKPFVFTLYGSPYLLSFVPELPSYILTYEYYPEAERAAARAIFGETPFTGTLPIALPEAYPRGHGLKTSAAPR
ncbi:MAG TPA: glycoside hydrolase family 3 N-terminal domain-containing protein [Candidatus Xenobia bacterium]|nr:glycoside hydrolase family 3 N-terminal domain-containing protein [Candidatus Xenobia bacterium]